VAVPAPEVARSALLGAEAAAPEELVAVAATMALVWAATATARVGDGPSEGGGSGEGGGDDGGGDGSGDGHGPVAGRQPHPDLPQATPSLC